MAHSVLAALTGAIPVVSVPWWIAPLLIGGVGATLVLRRIVPAVVLWPIVIVVLSIASIWPLTSMAPQSGKTIQSVALISAMLALLWSTCGTIAASLDRSCSTRVAGQICFVSVVHIVALFLGVVAIIVVAVELAMRLVVVGVDLVQRVPWNGLGRVGLEMDGVWTVTLLLAACLIAYPSVRDRRLSGCAFLCAVLLVARLCLRVPALLTLGPEEHQRTHMPLLLLVALSVLLSVTVVLLRYADRRVVMAQLHKGERAPQRWPGMATGITTVGIGLILLTCYHLAIPVPFANGGYRLTTLMVTGSAAVAAGAGFFFIQREWSVGVADVSLALASLAMCGLATAVVPNQPELLDPRYPILFNAMVFGAAMATLLWTGVALSWDRRKALGFGSDTRHRLLPYVKRFAFLNGALALVAAALMAIWPRWPGIATTDDSLGRVATGLSAHLCLLLVLLWCSRRLKRFTLQILTVLTVVAAAVFVLVRMAPFRPGYG